MSFSCDLAHACFDIHLKLRYDQVTYFIQKHGVNYMYSQKKGWYTISSNTLSAYSNIGAIIRLHLLKCE